MGSGCAEQAAQRMSSVNIMVNIRILASFKLSLIPWFSKLIKSSRSRFRISGAFNLRYPTGGPPGHRHPSSSHGASRFSPGLGDGRIGGNDFEGIGKNRLMGNAYMPPLHPKVRRAGP